jgi:hypothetical protein
VQLVGIAVEIRDTQDRENPRQDIVIQQDAAEHAPLGLKILGS